MLFTGGLLKDRKLDRAVRRIRKVGFELLFNCADERSVRVVFEGLFDLAESGQDEQPGKVGGLVVVQAADQGQQVREVVRQLGGFGDSVPPQQAAHAHEKFATLVVFAEQMPSDLQSAGWVELECLHIKLL